MGLLAANPKRKNKKSKKGMLCRTLPLRIVLQSETEGEQVMTGDGLPPGKVGLLLPAVVLQSEKTCMQFVNKKRVPPEKAGLDSSHKHVLLNESTPTKGETIPESGGEFHLKIQVFRSSVQPLRSQSGLHQPQLDNFSILSF